MPTKALSLDRTSFDLLNQTGNASAYVRQTVRERARRWRIALTALTEALEWSNVEIRASIDALSDANLVSDALTYGLPEAVQAALVEGGRVLEIPRRYGITPGRWQEMIELVSAGYAALALYELDQEARSGNDSLAQLLAGEPEAADEDATADEATGSDAPRRETGR